MPLERLESLPDAFRVPVGDKPLFVTVLQCHAPIDMEQRHGDFLLRNAVRGIKRFHDLECGLVFVAEVALDDLDEQSEIVEQLARETGMDLRVLDARQDIAWAASLPLGLAPSTLIAS